MPIMKLVLLIVCFVGLLLVILLSDYWILWRRGDAKDGYRNLPDAAKQIILPQLDLAIVALGGKDDHPPTFKQLNTMTPSKMYYMTKKDKYVGTYSNGFYVLNEDKYRNLLNEYASINRLFIDIKDRYPEMYNKIMILQNA